MCLSRPTRWTLTVGLLLSALAAGCSEPTPPPPEAVCNRDVVDTCEVVGLVFAQPRSLDATLDVAARAQGLTLAVFRSDYLCIPHRETRLRREAASRIAVVDPEELFARHQGALDFSALYDGYIIAESELINMQEEWSAAQRPWVRFDAAAVYVPFGSGAELTALDSVAWAGDVHWGLSASNDTNRYPGEIIISEDAMDPVPAMPTPEPAACPRCAPAECSPGLVSYGYCLLQNVWPQLGHSSCSAPPAHQLSFRVIPVLRYSVTDTDAPQLSHGMVLIFCHQSFSRTSIAHKLRRSRHSGCRAGVRAHSR